MRFLFWNIQKKDSFFNTIADIFIEHSIDVLGLAEFPKGSKDDLISVFRNKGVDVEWVDNVNFKVQVFYKKGVNIYRKFEGDLVHATEAIIGGIPFSIVFCHLPAKNMKSGCDQENRARLFCEELMSFENKEAHHDRTIVAGDFNMNPYDDGMISASSFNAMNSVSVSKRGSRKLSGHHYPFFYNPSWNLLGDKGKEVPAASYYFDTADFTQHYWHLLDQVVIRPSILSHFVYDDFKILYSGSNYRIINPDNTVNEDKYSDHLPITFTIN